MMDYDSLIYKENFLQRCFNNFVDEIKEFLWRDGFIKVKKYWIWQYKYGNVSYGTTHICSRAKKIKKYFSEKENSSDIKILVDNGDGIVAVFDRSIENWKEK